MSGIRFQIHTVPVDDGEIERYGIIVAELSSHERHYAGAALMNIMGMASELNETDALVEHRPGFTSVLRDPTGW